MDIMLKHFKEVIKPSRPQKAKVVVKKSKRVEPEPNIYDDGVNKNVTLFKYFIVDKSKMKILDEIELTLEQARKINDNIKDIAFVRQ